MNSAATAFDPIRLALEQARVRYAVGGSWASTAFGEPRFTNDVDILAEFTPESLALFLAALPASIYVDHDHAQSALRLGRPFNAIHMQLAWKFDFFPASAYPLGTQELDRAIPLANSGLSQLPIPFVTPEDILLAKLHWYRSGGEVSEVQWRDIHGIIRSVGDSLDREYLEHGATTLSLLPILNKAFATS